jgi:uncharacterized membrane protein YgcG
MRTFGRIIASTLVVVFVLLVAAMVGGFVDQAGRDTAFTIDRFDRDVVVAPTGQVTVVEQLEVTFTTGRRGIFRDLPRDAQAGPVFYTVLGVDQGSPDQPWNYTVEPGEDNDTRIRIGDAAITLAPGTYTYRIGYQIDGLPFVEASDPDLVEVRLDVPGFAWPTDIGPTTLRVQMPGEVYEADCVAGTLRTTSGCDTQPQIDGQLVTAELGPFEPRRSATVSIIGDASAFGPGLREFEATPLRERTGIPQVPWPTWVITALFAWLVAMPLVAFETVKAVNVYRDVETDPRLHDRVHPTAIPAPPHGMAPPEVAGLLLKQNADALFLATLVDLDQRGVVTTSTSGKEKKPTVEVHRASGVPVPPLYSPYVAGLLPGNGSITFSGEYSSTVASKSSAAANAVVEVSKDVFEANGYLHQQGGALRKGWVKGLLLLGWMGLGAIFGAVVALVSPVPWVVTLGLLVLVLGGWATIRLLWRHERLPLNSAGRDAVGQARSFEEYLRTVEAEQLEWAADQPTIDQRHPAVALLPYAIALGLANSWYRRFGDLLQKAAPAAGGAGVAWWASQRSFQGVSSSRSSSVTAPSSSGGGGGGGSGGGGGGGGSW